MKKPAGLPLGRDQGVEINGGGKALDGGASRVGMVFIRETLRHDYKYRVRYMGLATSLYPTALLAINPSERYTTTNFIDEAFARANYCNSARTAVYPRLTGGEVA